MSNQMETEAGDGDDSDDDDMWDRDDAVGCDDENKGVKAGMMAKMWDQEDTMGDFEDTRSTLRLCIALYYRTAVGSLASTE